MPEKAASIESSVIAAARNEVKSNLLSFRLLQSFLSIDADSAIEIPHFVSE